jgi:hypothetical protein
MAHPRLDVDGAVSPTQSFATASEDASSALQHRGSDAGALLAPPVSLSTDSLADAAAPAALTAPLTLKTGAATGRGATEITGEDELMALIVELRLSPAGPDGAGVEAGRRDEQQSVPSGSSRRTGSRGHTQQSSSIGTPLDTLDLCHRKIASLPDEMADVLREEIVR